MWVSLLAVSCLPTSRYGGTPQTLLTPIPSFPPCLPFWTPYPNPYTHTGTAQFLPLKIFQADKQIPITHQSICGGIFPWEVWHFPPIHSWPSSGRSGILWPFAGTSWCQHHDVSCEVWRHLIWRQIHGKLFFLDHFSANFTISIAGTVQQHSSDSFYKLENI